MATALAERSTRRQWLKKAVVFAAVAATGGALTVARTGDYAFDRARASKLQALTPWQFVVVQHLARRIVAPDDPSDATVLTADDAEVADFIDGYLAGMSRSMRRDLSRMLQYVEHLAPLSEGYLHRFTALSPEDQDQVLRGIESSRLDLLRAGFNGLKSLVMMGYYRDPRSWSVLSYRGPLVVRPVGIP